jgi:hypothetical protein
MWLDSDSSDSKDASDLDDGLEVNFHCQGSGREIPIGDAGDLKKKRSGRRVIIPDVFKNNPLYQDIGFPEENMSSYHCGRNPRKRRVKASKLNQEFMKSLDWDRTFRMLCGGTLGAMWAAHQPRDGNNEMDEPCPIFRQSKRRQSNVEKSSGWTQC